MNKVTMILTVGVASKRRFYFVYPNRTVEGELFIRDFDRNPLSRRRAGQLINSLGGIEAVLAKCMLFVGGSTEFRAIPPNERTFDHRANTMRWIECLRSYPNPTPTQASHIILFLLSEQRREVSK